MFASKIYGPLEARLTQSDRVIIGGLVEGVWPPAPRIDPWLSRPMRHELGLDLPERRIGLSAHDFAQLLGADEVILSHAAKVGGAPAVASRFLHRLEAVAGEARWNAAQGSGARNMCALRGSSTALTKVEPVAQPAPKPPRATRPLKLSVTAIEDWLRDPYTIYARYILRLSPLDPVDMPLSAADRGSAIHEALGEFTQTFATALPARSRRRPARHRPEIFRAADGATRGAGAVVAALPAHRRMVLRLGDRAARRYRHASTPRSEAKSRFRSTMSAPSFCRRAPTASSAAVTARFAILDYKTGQPPTGKQVRMGLSPQLTLEAAILREGGFAGIAGRRFRQRTRLCPAFRQQSAGRTEAAGAEDQAGRYAAAARRCRRLCARTTRGVDPQIRERRRAYTSLNLSMWTNRYGSYDDLARIKEWSAAGGLGIEEW